MHSGGTGSRAANRKNKGVDASSRRKKSKNSALKKQLVYYCQVGSWASTDPTPPAHRPAPPPTPTLPVHRPRARQRLHARGPAAPENQPGAQTLQKIHARCAKLADALTDAGCAVTDAAGRATLNSVRLRSNAVLADRYFKKKKAGGQVLNSLALLLHYSILAQEYKY